LPSIRRCYDTQEGAALLLRQLFPGLDWYAAQFAGAGSALARGEITPDYLYHPEALANIARDLPGARLF
jgi:hypothetical protein